MTEKLIAVDDYCYLLSSFLVRSCSVVRIIDQVIHPDHWMELVHRLVRVMLRLLFRLLLWFQR